MKANPHKPNIVGPEFTPVQSSVWEIDLGAEMGYSFTVTGAPNNTIDRFVPYVLRSASQLSGQTLFCSVYPKGREDDVGRISVVRWPVSTAFVTGATVSGSSAAAALQSSIDSDGIIFTSSTNRLRVTFNPAIFADFSGKRILGVDLVYQAAGTPGFVLEPTIESNTVIYPYGPYMTGPSDLTQVPDLNTVRFGDVNPWWSTSAGPDTQAERMPWRYADMQRFTGGTGGQLFIGVQVNNLPLSGFARLGYLALDIYICDESRVAYGGLAYGKDPTGKLTFNVTPTTQPTMRNPSFASPVTLANGDYTVTSTMADAGDKFNGGDRLALPSLYQYRTLPTHPAWKVQKFRRSIGNLPALTPVTSSTNDMVPVVLANSTTALQFGESSVAYVTVEGAPVYGANILATQDIFNNGPVSGATTYNQLRFYARRFNPTAPGDLSIVGPSVGYTVTPATFAALPELVVGEDGPGTGWREVTVTGAASLLGDGSTTSVQFTAATITNPIDQWQILTTRVFSPTPIKTRDVPSASVLGFYAKNRYDGTKNASLSWLAPEFTAVATDANSTAIVMFNMDAPAPTGMSISTATLAVTGVATGCPTPACIPTAILGNQINFGLVNSIVCDTFPRTLTGSWGISDTGQTWLNTDSSANVNGAEGTITQSTSSNKKVFYLGPSFVNEHVRATVKTDGIKNGLDLGVVLRRSTSADTMYSAELRFGISQDLTFRFVRTVAGVETVLFTQALTMLYVANQKYWIDFYISSLTLYAKVWMDGQPEPIWYQFTVNDASGFLTAGVSGVLARTPAGASALPWTSSFDDFYSEPEWYRDTSFEVQRKDTVDNVWQTISLTSPCVTGFTDFEARTGITSTYRIRGYNSSGFSGPWSTELAAFLPAPGVSGVGDGNSTLIFTNNSAPLASLAYTMQFDRDPEETFTLPEAGFGQLRTQYQRDFFVSFRPTERGGEQFSRLMLVQNAAIPTESLADFKNFRDLAWASLPYVCVRDELGNRWFANVTLPDVRVRNNRTVYMANITVTEVTNTPAPVTG